MKQVILSALAAILLCSCGDDTPDPPSLLENPAELAKLPAATAAALLYANAIKVFGYCMVVVSIFLTVKVKGHNVTVKVERPPA